MSGFGLPSLDEITPPEETKAPSTVRTVEEPSLEEVSDELQDLSDEDLGLDVEDFDGELPDVNEDEEDLAYFERIGDEDLEDEPTEIPEPTFEEEVEEVKDDTVADFGKLTGVIQKVRVGNDKDKTDFQLRTDDGEVVYLKEDEANYGIRQGDRVVATVDLEDVGATKTGVAVYTAIMVELSALAAAEEEAVEEETPKASKKSKKGKGPGPKKAGGLAGIVAAIKDELNEGKKDRGDYEEEPEEEEERPKKAKKTKPAKGKGGGALKELYLTVADFILEAWKAGIGFLSALPLVGKVFGLLKALTPIIKLVSRLWGLIVLLIIYLILSPIGGADKADKVDVGENERLIETEEVSLVTTGETFADGQLKLTVVNKGDIYADTALSAKIKEDKFLFGKKSDCDSGFFMLAPGEKRELSLKCGVKMEHAKVKSIDISEETK